GPGPGTRPGRRTCPSGPSGTTSSPDWAATPSSTCARWTSTPVGWPPPPACPRRAAASAHIPGAVNIPWNRAVTRDGTFRPDAELRELYADVLADPDRRIVAYCRIGERSS